MGQGGKLLLINKTPYRWTRKRIHSYQMNAWNDNFPAHIDAGQAVPVYVEWNQGVGKTQSDDAGDVSYGIDGTDNYFDIRARNTKAFDLQIHLQNFNAGSLKSGHTVSLGWAHDGFLLFSLAGAKDSFTSFTSGRHTEEWLSYIDNDKLLTDLTLPGTHDTCTYRVQDGVLNKLSTAALSAMGATFFGPLVSIFGALGWGILKIVSNATQCQTLTLRQQLDKGIRFLDIRLKNTGNKLMTYHGDVPLDMSFDEVYHECRVFLDTHPLEFIVMSVKCEDKSDISVLMKQQLDAHGSSWFTGNRIPALREIRNKIVLIRRYEAPLASNAAGIDATHWPDNTPFRYTNPAGISFDIQDEYKSYLMGQQDHKFNNYVLPCIQNAVQTGNRSKLFINFLSGTGGVFPQTLAAGYLSQFEGTNSLMTKHIAGWSSARLGIIPIDYPEYPGNGTLIQQLIALNDFSHRQPAALSTPHRAAEEAVA